MFIIAITIDNSTKYVLKMVFLGSKERTKEPKLECAYFLGQLPAGTELLLNIESMLSQRCVPAGRLASFGHLGLTLVENS